MKGTFRIFVLSWAVLLFTGPAAGALTPVDSLMRAYRFEEARRAARTDREIADAENAYNMSRFVHEPKVVARHRFSRDDFMLFYPLTDNSWRRTPNDLDSLGGPFAKASFVPKDAKEIIFCAPDTLGNGQIFRTELDSTGWSRPVLLDSLLCSEGEQVYPLLSPDGRTLRFSSDNMYGAGGLDLYESVFDESAGRWSKPVNMGFPYSSPWDDFLYMDTPDGNYSIFASNRECPEDSVNVYVLETDIMPVRKSVDDPVKLSAIMSLVPEVDPARMDHGTSIEQQMPDNPEVRLYMEKMETVRGIRDSLDVISDGLEELRDIYALSDNVSEREEAAQRIREAEASLPTVEDRLKDALEELGAIEMDFLLRGVVIDPSSLVRKAEREVVGASSSYTFTRMNFAGPLNLVFRDSAPEPQSEEQEE